MYRVRDVLGAEARVRTRRAEWRELGQLPGETEDAYTERLKPIFTFSRRPPPLDGDAPAATAAGPAANGSVAPRAVAAAPRAEVPRAFRRHWRPWHSDADVPLRRGMVDRMCAPAQTQQRGRSASGHRACPCHASACPHQHRVSCLAQCAWRQGHTCFRVLSMT